jgi:uncharacterized protein (TIGR02266 family)
MSDSDKRRHDRAPVALVVEYLDASDLVRDFTENLSAGGIFVQTPRELELGTQVQLTLSFPGLLRPIALTGVVRWLRAEPEDDRGVGIEFVDYTEEMHAQLAELIDGITAGDPGVMNRVLRVLVVEDNPHVAQLIRDGLQGGVRRAFGENLTFEFETAGNGREALDRLEASRFDALIIDIYLPVLDGNQVIRAVRADERLCELPIIAVSAGGSAARQGAVAAGADFFLDKPMRLKEILVTMQRLMDLRRG